VDPDLCKSLMRCSCACARSDIEILAIRSSGVSLGPVMPVILSKSWMCFEIAKECQWWMVRDLLPFTSLSCVVTGFVFRNSQNLRVPEKCGRDEGRSGMFKPSLNAR